MCILVRPWSSSSRRQSADRRRRRSGADALRKEPAGRGLALSASAQRRLLHGHRCRCRSHRRRACAGVGSFFRVLDEVSSTATFNASITRDISPPEAISCRGFRGSPGLVAMRSSTSSQPCAVQADSCSWLATEISKPYLHGQRVDLRLRQVSRVSLPAAFRCAESDAAACLYAFRRLHKGRAQHLERSRRDLPLLPVCVPLLRQARSHQPRSCPYLRFRRSSSARRSSISARRSGEALMRSA